MQTNFTQEAILQGVDPTLTIVMTRAMEAQREYERATQYHSFLEAMYTRFIKGGSIKIAEALEAMKMSTITSIVVDNQEAFFERQEFHGNVEEAYSIRLQIAYKGEGGLINHVIHNKREAIDRIVKDFRTLTNFDMDIEEESLEYKEKRLTFTGEIWFV